MRDTGRRSFIQGLAGVSAAGMLGAAWHVRAAQTQAWPVRPIKLVVTFPPGGSSDIVARVLAPALAEKLGQSVVIDNKPGAGSSIGAQIVAHSANDGYTLLVSNSAALSIAPSLLQSPGYDPLRSFEHLAYIGAVPTVFAVHPSVPVNSLSELVSWIRSSLLPSPLAAAAPPRWAIWWRAVCTDAQAVHGACALPRRRPHACGPAQRPYQAGHRCAAAEHRAAQAGPAQAAGADILTPRGAGTDGAQRGRTGTGTAGLGELRRHLGTGWPAQGSGRKIASAVRQISARPEFAQTLEAQGFVTRDMESKAFTQLIADQHLAWGDIAKKTGAKL